MSLLPDDVDRYLERLLAGDDPALAAMERANRREKLPLIDRQVGRLLTLLCRLTGAGRVLEIGTAIGYSTTYLARAVGTGGRVLSIEIDPDRARRAHENLTRAGVADRVTILVADARRALAEIEGPFDLVFNDGEKRMYPDVAAAATRLVRPGGLLVSDNALWDGAVARKPQDADTKAIRLHNERLARHPEFLTTILPVRDGVLVARRRVAESPS